MSTRDENTLPASRPRSRKSMPSAMDKENVTADLGALSTHKRAPLEVKKKSRSKSIGPGGLDVLRDGAGNRRQSLGIPTPRSILKPSIPSIQETPAHKDTDSIVAQAPNTNTTITGIERLDNPFEVIPSNAAVVETRVLLRTEQQQQQAAEERDMKERKEVVDQDAKARREARRKSLANRRVSFAPEATLHTWDVVEYAADSTTSSSSTRRASSAVGETPSAHRQEEPGSAIPSTLSGLTSEHINAASDQQHESKQKTSRRSSGLPSLDFECPEDEFLSSSPSSGGSGIGEDDVVDDGSSSSGSDSDEDGTAMILDEGDDTGMSMASMNSGSSSTESTARLNQALQLAARQAGTRTEHLTEDDEEQDFVSFTPWSHKMDAQGHENLNPFSPAFKAKNEELQEDGNEEDMDMDMDITQAVGRIMPKMQQTRDDKTMDMTVAIGGILPSTRLPSSTRRKSVISKRQSLRRRSSGASSDLGDTEMELTRSVGYIQHMGKHEMSKVDENDDEDMTMELTTVVGGVLASGRCLSGSFANRKPMHRVSAGSAQEDETMDMEMTMAVGTILPNNVRPGNRHATRRASTESIQEDATMEMEMTMAVGKILPGIGRPSHGITEEHTTAEVVTGLRVTGPQHATDAINVGLKENTHIVASESGSPSISAFRGHGLRRSGQKRASMNPTSKEASSATGTPVKETIVAAKQSTPQQGRSSKRVGRSPPSGRAAGITASPYRSPGTEVLIVRNTPEVQGSQLSTTPQSTSRPKLLFRQDDTTGLATPSIVLSHKKRRLSGVGIDKAGLGSPHLAAMLNRRGSIGEDAASFVPGQFNVAQPKIRFTDLVEMEVELENNRRDDENREDGRRIMEREADLLIDDKETTMNLKEMILSLTPKKNPLKGRKSLHVGAAKGILGKRPAELDDDDDDDDDNEDDSGIKRLKNHQGSPVKNVKLKAPPTIEETTGRLTRAARRSLAEVTGNHITPTIAVEPGRAACKSPKGTARFRDVGASAQEALPLIENADPIQTEDIADSQNDEPIQLQDFLNMTSIRFIELNTTKRRHTVAPVRLSHVDAQSEEDDMSFERCLIAAACTVPMLELFQHSCHELKKYISEGRGIVRTIETETFEENPPLFREYLTAPQDLRTLMDTQFKNVKTHARHTSKGMWYQWRMQLLAGLMAGLNKTADGMQDDREVIQHQLDLLDSVLPALAARCQHLSEEESILQATASELANCDQEELHETRANLVALDEDVTAKRQLISELRDQIQEKDRLIDKASKRKQVCMDDIREAEKTREECRGWTGCEVSQLKENVDALEKEYGWTITGVSRGTTISLSYRYTLELVLDIAKVANSSNQETRTGYSSSQIDLWYIGSTSDSSADAMTIEVKFLVENIRDHCRSLPQTASVREILDHVGSAWDRAVILQAQIRALRSEMPTEVIRTSDSSIVVSSTMLLKQIETKVKLKWRVAAQSAQEGLKIDIGPKISVVYGTGFNQDKLVDFMSKKLEESDMDARRSWVDAALELEQKLLARGRK